MATVVALRSLGLCANLPIRWIIKLHAAGVWHESDPGGACLYELDLAKKTTEDFPLHVDGDPGSFHLSRSGNRLVLAAARREHTKQPKFTATSTVSVWVMDLGSNKRLKLFSFPPRDEIRGTDRPWCNLSRWLDDK
jgi:hypothetical protein